jgi:hypothetical protein
MKVVIIKPIHHDKLGSCNKGRVVELHDKLATRLLKEGAVERYETKVIREIPLPVAGADQPSSASPAVPASPKTTSKPSKRGGRKKKGAASSS